MKWNAQNYQATCGRVTEHGSKLVDVLRELHPKRVLDLGCGTGVLTNDIAGFAEEVVGIDQSDTMIEKARTLYPNIEFMVMDACNLPWNGRFDAVFSNAVLHFIKAQDQLLASVHRTLADGGFFVCEFGTDGNLQHLLEAVERACTRRGKAYTLRFFYPAEALYKRLLEAHGFFVQSIKTYDLDTKLIEGEPGLRNWVNQIFYTEMQWFGDAERAELLDEIERDLRDEQWDGSEWHLPNKRLQVVARKG